MTHIAPFLFIIALFIILAVIIIARMNYKIKKKILDTTPLDDKAYAFMSQLSEFGPVAYKWGVILFFGGAGLVVLQFVPYDMEYSPLPFGVEMIFVALGFLVYHFTSPKQDPNKK